MGINAFRATIGAAALFVAWRTGLLQAVLLLPLTIVRGVLSPLVSRPEPRDADSIAGAVLNVTTDHKQVFSRQSLQTDAFRLLLSAAGSYVR